eukprot:PhM_4_TR17180/c0_g1_i1/m.4216
MIKAADEPELTDIKPQSYYKPDTPTITVQGRQVRPQRQMCHAPLAQITTNRLKLSALWSLPFPPDEEQTGWLQWLGPKLSEISMEPPQGAQNYVGRHMTGDATSLVSWGVIELTHKSGWVHPIFKVPKGDEARLIVDCRRLNAALPRPGNMQLPDMREIFRELLKRNVMSQYDGKSYFYQIPMLPEVHHLFQVKLGGARGAFDRYQLTVLPMGFSFAPGIAQAISRIVLQNCEHRRGFQAAWIDNFVFGADSLAEMEAMTSQFKDVCVKIGLELKPDRTESSTTMDVLGATINTDRREISVGPKMIHAINLTVRDLETKRRLSRRDVFVATGKILWVVWAVAQVPLALAERPIRIMSMVGREIEEAADWNGSTDSVKGEELISMLMEAKQVARTHTSQFHPSIRSLTAWTDASCTALGYVIRSEDGVIGWQR